LAAKGQSGFGHDQNDAILIPFTTEELKVLGVAAPTQVASSASAIFTPPTNPLGLQPKLTGFVHIIFVQARSPELVQTALHQITDTLARRHRIQPGQTNDFSVNNLSDITSAAEDSSRIMALLLAAVASISLVVGGIGIMNILLVSVTERTREIGIRMAIGARRVHVLLQFLVGAVLLSIIGGGDPERARARRRRGGAADRRRRGDLGGVVGALPVAAALGGGAARTRRKPDARRGRGDTRTGGGGARAGARRVLPPDRFQR